jgi:UDP-GlcNAc3NAcA epimerase
MKIAAIVGARPQFIKAWAVTRAIGSANRGKRHVREVLVHTGQHYDYLMDRIFFEELNLPKPDYHLGVGSGSHGKQTGLMLERIEAVLAKETPDLVMVYGDTNSTLSGALAAAKLSIPVAHVEAGLRSYNTKMPEEINRLLTDHLSTVLFCPTRQAVLNLLKEGIRSGGRKVIKNVGDVMYDSILYYSKIAGGKSTILKDLGLYTQSALRHAPRRVHGSPEPHMVQGAFQMSPYYLATLHRAENTDNPKRLKSILRALNEISKNTPVVLPLHPRTRKMIKNFHLESVCERMTVIQPVSYLDMLVLEGNAKTILTDSGGVQKEAYWLGVPCLTLREETEWMETLQYGWNRLVGAEPNRVVGEVAKAGRKAPARKRKKIFGDGKAGEKIVRVLIEHFS